MTQPPLPHIQRVPLGTLFNPASVVLVADTLTPPAPGVINGVTQPSPMVWYKSTRVDVDANGVERPIVAYDAETYLIIPGCAVPRMVSGQFTSTDGETDVFLREDAVLLLHYFLDNGYRIIGHNTAYDLAVACGADPSLYEKVIQAYDEDRIEDVRIRDQLIMLAQGQLADENETGAKKANRFDLASIVKRRLNVDLSADKAKTEKHYDGTVTVKVGKGEEIPWRLRFRELDGVPVSLWPKAAYDYAAADPMWTLAAWAHQEEETAPEGIPDVYPQTRAAAWLFFMQAWGIRTDVGPVNELHAKVKAEYEHLNDTIRKAGLLNVKMKKGEEVESKNMNALKALVKQAYNGSPPQTGGAKKHHKECQKTLASSVLGNAVCSPKCKVGIPNVATDRDTLTNTPAPHLAGCTEMEFHKDASGKMERVGGCVDGCLVGVLKAVGERSGVEKILSTFIPALLMGTQFPVNPSWNAIVATGRSSCRDPNLQQPPRKGGVRECFIPRPGHWFVAADYSFIELCTFAQICLDLFGYSRLADAINAGIDPHLDMAVFLLNLWYGESITYEEAKIRLKAKDPRMVELRQASKAVNFGLPGGLGADSFVEFARANYGVVLTAEKGKQAKEAWKTKWTEGDEYLKYIGRRTQLNGSFTMIQHRSGRWRGECGYCDGANTGFQGMAADGAKDAGWCIHKECTLLEPYKVHRSRIPLAPPEARPALEEMYPAGTSALYGSRAVLFLHDEFIVESPIAKAPRAGLRLAAVMTARMKRFAPDLLVQAAPVLTERWFKGADSVYDEKGMPILWQPKKKAA